MREITQQDIYRAWLGDVIIGKMYNSPIPGRRDRTPSFQLYIYKGGIRWKDWGLGDQYGWDAQNLVQHMEGLPLTNEGFGMAYHVIKSRIGKNVIAQPLVQLRRRADRETTPYIKERDFLDFELEYWDRFDITKEELISEDISSVDSMSWAGKEGEAHVVSTPSDPAFVFWWARNPASWKIYRPLANKRDKFRQDNVSGIVEGMATWMNDTVDNISKINDGKVDTLFITSSTKDRLVIKHAFPDRTKYNAINPRSETGYKEIVDNLDVIDQWANRVVILYDADDAGYKGSQNLAKYTNFETYDMRGKLDGQKDFADFVDSQRGNHSYEELVNTITQTIKL